MIHVNPISMATIFVMDMYFVVSGWSVKFEKIKGGLTPPVKNLIPAGLVISLVPFRQEILHPPSG